MTYFRQHWVCTVITHSLVDHRRIVDDGWRQQMTTLLSFFFTAPCLVTSPSAAECSYNHSTLLCRPSTVFWVGDVNHLHCPPRLSVPKCSVIPSVISLQPSVTWTAWKTIGMVQRSYKYIGIIIYYAFGSRPWSEIARPTTLAALAADLTVVTLGLIWR